MESEYYLVIALTFFGFIALAVALLLPVYRFLKREETAEKTWTEEELEARAKRMDEREQTQ